MKDKIVKYQKYAEEKLIKLNALYDECSTTDIENRESIDRNIQYWRGTNDAYKKILSEITG